MTPDPLKDPSLVALATLQDPNASAERRQQAFEQMLEMGEGWWAKGMSLPLFTYAAAMASARALTARHGLDVDSLDWEGAGDEALMVLFQPPPRIESPRAWLRGVIWNKLREQMRDVWPELTAERVQEDLVAPPTRNFPVDEESGPHRQEDTRRQERDDQLLSAILELPPALREVARLRLFEGYTPQEIAAKLHLEPAAVRQRLLRMRRALFTKLEPMWWHGAS